MLRTPDPSRHVDGGELRQCRIEERPSSLAIASRSTPRVHERLIVVDDRAQRARGGVRTPWQASRRQNTLACDVARAVSKPKDGNGPIHLGNVGSSSDNQKGA